MIPTSMTSTQVKSDAADLVEGYAERQAIAEDRAAAAPGGAYLEPAKTDGGVLLGPSGSSLNVELFKAQDLHPVPAKVSSPELASLAAKYLNISPAWLFDSLDRETQTQVAADVRRLAASVLSQA